MKHLILALALCLSAFAGPTNNCGVEVTITATTNTFVVGKPLPIEYQLMSVTNQTRFFVDRGRLTDVKVEVVDASGNALASKVNYDQQGLDEYKRMFIRLRQSEPVKLKLDISNYADISQPGTYKVTVKCPIDNEDHTKCEAQSNPLAVSVNPK